MIYIRGFIIILSNWKRKEQIDTMLHNNSYVNIIAVTVKRMATCGMILKQMMIY